MSKLNSNLLSLLQYSTPVSQLTLSLSCQCSFYFLEKQSELPDPFVKIVLFLEKPRKGKTEHVNNSLDPVWEESFGFTIPKSVVLEKEIELVILDKKGLFIR